MFMIYLSVLCLVVRVCAYVHVQNWQLVNAFVHNKPNTVWQSVQVKRVFVLCLLDHLDSITWNRDKQYTPQAHTSWRAPQTRVITPCTSDKSQTSHRPHFAQHGWPNKKHRHCNGIYVQTHNMGIDTRTHINTDITKHHNTRIIAKAYLLGLGWWPVLLRCLTDRLKHTHQ